MSYTKAMSLMKRGPSRPTLFKVRLPGDKISSFSNDYLDMFCTTASIPEIRANTVAVSGHENMGIVREQPTAIMFGKPFAITCIADADMVVYKELRNWFNRVAQNANQTPGSSRTQRMNYYSSYVSDIELIKMEQGLLSPELTIAENIGNLLEGVFGDGTYRETMRVNFIKAYPVSLGPVQLNTETTNSYTTFQCSFTYESYTID